MTRASLRGGSALAGLLVLGLGGAAAAQDSTVVEEVVVTGSFIRGTPEDAALPVDVVSSEELARRGSPTTVDLIKSLPVSGPVLGDSNQFSTTAQGQVGAGTVNLRGIGSLRTLVLLNGRRTTASPGAGSGGVDTNLLPVAAIGRVEVLKDGAAATYGSDAIGGVVNFITRRNFSGLEASADYRFVDGSDGDYTASLVYGWVGERSNILLSAGYQHRSELRSTERDWANQDYLVNPSGYSVLGQPGSFLPRNGATPTAGVQRDANCTPLGGYAGFSGTTPACFFTYVPFDNVIEDENRYQIYGEFNVDLADNLRFHAEAHYAKTDIPNILFSPSYPPTSGPNGPGSVGVFTAPVSNPGVLTGLQQAGLSPAQIAATNNVSLTLWRALGSGGNPAEDFGGQVGSRAYEIYRVSGGFSGEFDFGVGWDTAITYSQATSNQNTTDILIDRLQRALNGLGGNGCTGSTPGQNGCQYLNPFSNGYASNPALGLTNPGYVSANANDPDLVAWLFDTQQTENRQSLLVIDAVLNGDLGDFELPGGRIGWAVGAQYRRNELQTTLNSPFQDARVTPCPVVGVTTCAFATGPYIFLGQSRPSQLDDTIYAVFAEASLPITDALNAQLAIRFEDYGGETGSTTNPKLALKWQLTDSFALRGSVGTTFRGPTPVNRSANQVTGLSGIIAAGNNFKSVDLPGDPAIGPEKALTYNVGAIFEQGGFRAIVDYWSFKIEDQITSVPANVVATAVAGVGNGTQLVNCASPLRDLITFNNNNACAQGVTVGNDIARVLSPTTNGPEINVSGVDVQMDFTANDVWGGRARAGVSASYYLEYKFEAFEFNGVLVNGAYDAKGFTNYDRLPGTISDWRANAYAEYGRGPHNLRADLTFVDGAVDNRAPISVQDTTGALRPVTFGQKVDDFYTLDLTYQTELPWGVVMTASAFNVFDRDPSAARLELSYDPFIGNPYGRTYKLGFRKRF
ncbi:TonB-dependent receptor domain-containing protein [Phenylobacterium sp.]|uniref:TonB-dependent receptor domain-containing protein n=1 Tax=Phenylobacterium sp. TaxID=1871053 RepID=UPI00273133FA|nr:TonB-dependent receptor [Phenylobacterium sp.]MDP1617061.1 TonB-dependent receptor [Phenylobacterium sp.]MDP1988523.1 TonB-dependent receptor [Phenylobacterium sp.]